MKFSKKSSQAFYKAVTRRAQGLYQATRDHFKWLDAQSKYNYIVAKSNQITSPLLFLSAVVVGLGFIGATYLTFKLSDIITCLMGVPLTGLWLGLEVARETARSAFNLSAKIGQSIWAKIKFHTPSKLTHLIRATSHAFEANSKLFVAKIQLAISQRFQTIRSTYKKALDKMMPVTKLDMMVASDGEVLLDIQPLTSRLQRLTSLQPKPVKMPLRIEQCLNEARSGHLTMQGLNTLLQFFTIRTNSPDELKIRAQVERLAQTDAKFIEIKRPRSSI